MTVKRRNLPKRSFREFRSRTSLMYLYFVSCFSLFLLVFWWGYFEVRKSVVFSIKQDGGKDRKSVRRQIGRILNGQNSTYDKPDVICASFVVWKLLDLLLLLDYINKVSFVKIQKGKGVLCLVVGLNFVWLKKETL